MIHHDIVGSLPLELLIQVVEFLELEDIVRNQRVCKRWHKIFSCDTIITPLLRESLAFLGLDSEGVSTAVAMADAMSYFRWRHGLEHARPVKEMFIPWPANSVIPEFRTSLCHSRRLCFDIPERNEVHMLNLETGETSIWTGGESSLPRGLMLSDRYLVIVRGRGLECYELTAWNIHTGQKLNQRVPHEFFPRCSITEEKVVLAPIPQPSSHPLYVWDLSSNHVQKINGFSHLWLTHIDAAENVLVTFEIIWTKQPSEVRQTKWTATTGWMLERKIYHLPISSDGHDGRFYACDYGGSFGHKTVSQIFFGTNEYATLHIEYDYVVDKLNVRWIHAADPFNKNVRDVYSTYITPYLVYRWEHRTGPTATYNVSTGLATQHNRLSLDERVDPPRFYDDFPGMDFCRQVVPAFGDREVLGRAGSGGIQLWFFSPKFAPDHLRIEPTAVTHT